MNAKMPELKECFELAGFTNVKTFLSSGNIAFDTRNASNASLEKKIEKAMEENLDRIFDTIVRSVEHLQQILAADAFKKHSLKKESKRVITFLRDKPKTIPALPIVFEAASILKVEGQEVYSTYIPGPKGPVFMNLIEKTFGKQVTTRTWDTVTKVVR